LSQIKKYLTRHDPKADLTILSLSERKMYVAEHTLYIYMSYLFLVVVTNNSNRDILQRYNCRKSIIPLVNKGMNLND